MQKIPIEVSARHMHISRRDLDALFGEGYKLKKLKDLTQPGEFACKEKVIIKNGAKELSVRVIGPARKNTQIEISKTDAVYLGLNPPTRKSGKVAFSPGLTLVNKKKKIKIKRGVIIPWRHIHCTLEDYKNLKLRKYVSVGIGGNRALIFEKVRVRVDKNYKLSMHIDTDEGNAAGINKTTLGHLV